MPNQFPTSGFLQLQLKLKGIWQRRELGQHFLFDEHLLNKIADTAALDKQTLAVEIGPGAGTLTAQLGARAGGVLAVEYDQRLRPIHQDAFGTIPEVEFDYHDVLKFDLLGAAREAAARRGLSSMVLTGNLPFQITSPLLFNQCGPDVPWRRMAFMVQKEVADRIASPPGCKAYGILTVKLAYWWRVTQRFEVPAHCFVPPPQVDAAVLVLEPIPPAEQISPNLWRGLSKFIDAAFGQRRKMLFNSLAGRWPSLPNKDAARDALLSMGISETVRAEELTPAELLKLYRTLAEQNSKQS